MDDLPRPAAVAVACSGGRDSVALLHATWRAARQHGVVVHALHVNHGLSERAQAWEAHVRAQCARWSRRGGEIQAHVRRLHLSPVAGESTEALAREARYAALSDMAHGGGCRVVLLAHHAHDQAETFLLQALRGAGAAGLAAMPGKALREGVLWVRPWLHHPRSAIEAYVRRHRLGYVEDDSNAHTHFARNRLRLQVWPALEAAFPQALKVLGAAARRAQDASACLDALADLDLERIASGPAAVPALDLQGLLSLEAARRRNVLRRWLRDRLGHRAAASLIERLAEELTTRGRAEWPLDGDHVLLGQGGRLQIAARSGGRAHEVPPPILQVTPAGRDEVRVPEWRGTLRLTPVLSGGVARSRVAGLCLLARSGGERFQRAPHSPARALKKQFQSAGVPAWLRDGPLVQDAEGHLLYVPGLGLDARALAALGEPQVSVEWCPDIRRDADAVREPRRTG